MARLKQLAECGDDSWHCCAAGGLSKNGGIYPAPQLSLDVKKAKYLVVIVAIDPAIILYV